MFVNVALVSIHRRVSNCQQSRTFSRVDCKFSLKMSDFDGSTLVCVEVNDLVRMMPLKTLNLSHIQSDHYYFLEIVRKCPMVVRRFPC